MSRGINLLPWRELRKTRENNRFKLQLAICLVGAMLLVILWHLRLKREGDVMWKEKILLDQKHRSLEDREQGVEDLKKSLKNLEQDMLEIKELKNHRDYFVKLFNALNQSIPEGISFSELTIDDHEVLIRGKTKTLSVLESLLDSYDKLNSGGVKPVIKVVKWENGSYYFDLSYHRKEDESSFAD